MSNKAAVAAAASTAWMLRALTIGDERKRREDRLRMTANSFGADRDYGPTVDGLVTRPNQ